MRQTIDLKTRMKGRRDLLKGTDLFRGGRSGRLGGIEKKRQSDKGGGEGALKPNGTDRDLGNQNRDVFSSWKGESV